MSTGHLALDFDVFTLDNSGTAKEGVGRTYMGFDGYAPITGYLAEEGYCLGLELRPGTQHSARETPDFLKRLLPRARAVSSLPLLVRADSGFDGAAIFVAMAEARASGSLDWLTSLDLPAADIVKLYQGHGTHEQFHSEFKTDLDMEQLPSGKFATNDLVLSLAVLAFNILRAIGQATLISPASPVRHPAKRRRIRTVMQEIIGIAARVIQHARRLTLGLGECCTAFAVFERHHQALLQFSD